MLVVGGAVDLLRRFGVQAALDALARRPASYLIAVPSMVRLMMLDARADAAFDRLPDPRLRRRADATRLDRGAARPLAGGPAVQHLRADGVHVAQPRARAGRRHRPRRHRRPPGRAACGSGSSATTARTSRNGAAGEVWLAGPTRMLGYLDDPAATADAFRGPWLRTGDLGAVDDDGFLTLHGRIAPR